MFMPFVMTLSNIILNINRQYTLKIVPIEKLLMGHITVYNICTPSIEKK